MNANRITAHFEIATKVGLIGAAAAFDRGVARHRAQAAYMQIRVNAYGSAVLRNRAAARNRAADARRDALVADIICRLHD